MTAQPTLVHVHPATLLPVLEDIRDRNSPAYDEFFKRLVADIRTRGVQVPLIASRDSERVREDVRVIDGETRRLAALVTGISEVPVLLYDQKPDQAALKLAQLQANAMRLDMGPLEYAAVYQELMRLYGWSQAELARQIHENPAQVAKRLAISVKLGPEVRALVASGTLSARGAYAISRLSDPQQQAELARKAVELPMAVESVEEAVDKLLGGKKTKKASKPMKLKGDGVEATVKQPDIEAIQAFGEALVATAKKMLKENTPIEFLPHMLAAVLKS